MGDTLDLEAIFPKLWVRAVQLNRGLT
jgi:hypothetical protein